MSLEILPRKCHCETNVDMDRRHPRRALDRSLHRPLDDGGQPKDAYGMIRYALPYMHRGKLKPGDAAPDAPLLALSGKEQFRIHDRIGNRPLMVVFGSYT